MTARLAPEGLKWCYGCRRPKEYADFFRNKSQSDGYGNLCRPCSREREHHRAPYRDWSDHHARRRQKPDYAAKLKARMAVKEAVKTGRLTREPCVECDDPRSEGHHHDYARPLDVVWVCSLHHKALHKSPVGTTVAEGVDRSPGRASATNQKDRA